MSVHRARMRCDLDARPLDSRGVRGAGLNGVFQCHVRNTLDNRIESAVHWAVQTPTYIFKVPATQRAYQVVTDVLRESFHGAPWGELSVWSPSPEMPTCASAKS